MALTVLEGRRIELRGTVQGVGMRPWIYRTAREHGVTGRVWNQSSGVTIDSFGTPEALDAFVHALETCAPPAASIETLYASTIAPEDVSEFVILHSDSGDQRRVSIPPDLATCPQCAAEVVDPSDRRFRYPFTNCTNCGPRYTIASDVPYDRPATTMAPFVMCAACQQEYDDPLDRRFHAQPNACPDCGPRLTALAANGRPLEAVDPIRLAAAQLRAGRIVAVKGIGGFHLACDATSSSAVARLRMRKRRDEKPLAVMVRSIEAAERVAVIPPVARQLLLSVERPIVLVPRRDDGGLAENVAPHNPLVGLMLPYTPLHHLLLGDARVPLVMTSANLSEEPIAYRNDEAVTRLGGIADMLLVHDREIMTRCDDSVAAVIAGGPVLLRRSRGFVPRGIALRQAIDVPVLACGALLKNTFCLAHGDRAWLGPHIGDLENAETFDAYEEAIELMQRFIGVRAEIVAHDLHPDYLSTCYAVGTGLPSIGVQHHHAHVASAIAEHGLEGPVIGVAFDGTGFGTDGTAWGGEFFVGDAVSVRRLATFRPLQLPGGDAAIRQPWRIALALIDEALGADSPVQQLALFRSIPAADVAGVRGMVAARLNVPSARGVGRYFDAIGALALARPAARFEGQIALGLNMAAAASETAAYDYAVQQVDGLIEIDLRPTVGAIVRDLLDGAGAPVVSARFHNTLVTVTAATINDITRDFDAGGRARVVLTGGCFQNARLAEGLCEALHPTHEVFLHRRVPPGDGGIALGQALVAAASIARS